MCGTLFSLEKQKNKVRWGYHDYSKELTRERVSQGLKLADQDDQQA